MSLFYYKRISAKFIQQLADKVLDTESIVLIGPRYGGKRHVMHQLHESLQKGQYGTIVDLRFLDNGPLYTEEQVNALIRRAVSSAAPEISLGSSDGFNNLTEPIQQLAESLNVAKSLNGSVILLASNIDGMAHHLARTFLEEVRMMVEKGVWRNIVIIGTRLYLRFGIRDPELRRKLTPDYPVACKRIVMSSLPDEGRAAPGTAR